MKLHRNVIEELMVCPGEPAGLPERSTHKMDTPWRDHSSSSSLRHIADHDLESFKHELASAQELLYASDTYSLLVILQALDAAGKDGTIKHVMSGVNP
jgi:polyphosphate kinase 2 (PPK2 family)